MSKREIDGRFDEIVDFAGVERFLDQLAKNYSSVMYVRLRFSVVIVSRAHGTLAEMCDRLAWIQAAELRTVGKPAAVLAAYRKREP
jgi:ABC-type polysaccharide/polyol phosphate transport system ATPase subunit